MIDKYIKVSEYDGLGYMPMIDYEQWRVALLRYIDELEIQNICKMQKHNETDEVFILLEGECVLFSGGNGNEIGEIEAIKLKPLKLYNVKKGVWHTHTLKRNTTVLIVENKNTDDQNSPCMELTTDKKRELLSCYEKLK